MRSWPLVLIVLIVLGNGRCGFGFTARVVSIPDGDTVEVFTPGERYKIPIDLYGIDCPEKQQAFGLAAKEATAALVGGKEVWIETLSIGRSGRRGAVITVAGKNVNEILVSKGWAWVHPDYCQHPFCADWRKLQAEARTDRRGLWTALQPQAPWEWRKRGKRELLYRTPDTKTPVWRYSP